MRTRSMHVRSPLDLVRSSCVCVVIATASLASASANSSPRLKHNRATDAEIASALASLESKLAEERESAKWATAARLPLWDFARQWQTRTLTPAQEARIVARVTAMGRPHPSGRGAVQRALYMITALAVGKTAPDITGRDLEGAAFRLTDFRGKVVTLIFSGDWCGICRSDYPFTKQLLVRFGTAPVVVLGVDSSADLGAAKRIKREHGLDYRSWWDGHGESNRRGPIATTWNVVGWPTVYVIDPQGIIRFVDVRRDLLIEAVGQLVTEDGR